MADNKQNKPAVEEFINWSRIPRKLIWVIIILGNLSLVPLSLVYAHRNLNWHQPRTSIIPDMDDQYRYRAQQAAPEFADGRVMRSWPEGTVPVGMLRDDDHYYRGTIGEVFATTFPSQITFNDALLDRGKDRYTIYCAVCHGEGGYGDGMIQQRASELAISGDHRGLNWTPPLSYHSDELRNRPVGHIFNTISNGVRTMPAYKSQISVEDRWAIIAYIRTLQISQWTEVSSVDQQQRDNLIRQIEATRNAEAATEGDAPGTDTEQTEESGTAGDDTGNQAESEGGNG